LCGGFLTDISGLDCFFYAFFAVCGFNSGTYFSKEIGPKIINFVFSYLERKRIVKSEE